MPASLAAFGQDSRVLYSRCGRAGEWFHGRQSSTSEGGGGAGRGEVKAKVKGKTEVEQLIGVWRGIRDGGRTFVPMLKEIWAIYAFTHDVLTDMSVEQTATLVNQMAHYGILKTL
ncbi:hypothetical protein B0H13DRAFT_1867442 [Mycena leptocephala]|nr:hypothetical protein B0H13DRAFT_1867442 [Mycena leptocephala]